MGKGVHRGKHKGECHGEDTMERKGCQGESLGVGGVGCQGGHGVPRGIAKGRITMCEVERGNAQVGVMQRWARKREPWEDTKGKYLTVGWGHTKMGMLKETQGGHWGVLS